MKLKLIMALSVLTVAVLAGCNNAKSPDAVGNDVAAAQKKAAENVADVRKDASKDNASATDKVDDKSKDLNNVEAKGAYDVALARAEGNHKVALEKCDAVSGDAQSKCKDMADADYNAAKANAKASEMSTKQ
jgi:predicted small secreted protein